MKDSGRLFWLIVGGVLGVGATLWAAKPPQNTVQAAGSDRFEDYVMCTGAVSGGRTQLDGVWLLDYRAGKLLGTVLDKNQGKINGWAEVDLVNEFGLQPKANVHFMMSTGHISPSQTVLYVSETTSGKLAVYSMGPKEDQTGIQIKRHDLVLFRQNAN